MNLHKRHRTEITIETISVTTIKTRPSVQETAYCGQCRRNITPDGVLNSIIAIDPELDDSREISSDGLAPRISDNDIYDDVQVVEKQLVR